MNTTQTSNLIAAFALTIGFTVAPSSAQVAPTPDIQQIEKATGKQIERLLLGAAREAGVAAQPGTLVRTTSPGFQVAAMATSAADWWALSDLGAGVDTNFLYMDHGRAGLAGGWYVQRLWLDDPQAPQAMEVEVLDLDGQTVGRAVGDIKIIGDFPPPGPVRAVECTESWSDGVNSDGESCTNYVKVCWDTEDSSADVAVQQACIVWNVE